MRPACARDRVEPFAEPAAAGLAAAEFQDREPLRFPAVHRPGYEGPCSGFKRILPLARARRAQTIRVAALNVHYQLTYQTNV